MKQSRSQKQRKGKAEIRHNEDHVQRSKRLADKRKREGERRKMEYQSQRSERLADSHKGTTSTHNSSAHSTANTETNTFRCGLKGGSQDDKFSNLRKKYNKNMKQSRSRKQRKRKAEIRHNEDRVQRSERSERLADKRK